MQSASELSPWEFHKGDSDMCKLCRLQTPLILVCGSIVLGTLPALSKYWVEVTDSTGMCIPANGIRLPCEITGALAGRGEVSQAGMLIAGFPSRAGSDAPRPTGMTASEAAVVGW